MPIAVTYSFGLKEFLSKEHCLWKSTIAELVGTFVLNFFLCGASTQPEDGIFTSLSFGLGVFIAITIVGHLSGGHVNPAVTVAMLLTGRVSLIRSVCYIASQCLGAAVATSTVKIVLDDAYHNDLGHTNLAKGMSELQGLGIEFILGLMLVLTIFSAYDPKKTESRTIGPFAIGMSVTLGHLGTARYTGCGMNPARTFGTAYATNNWDSHWIYWAGPILGGMLAALVYVTILEKNAEIPRSSEASDKCRIHAYGREMEKLEKSGNFL